MIRIRLSLFILILFLVALSIFSVNTMYHPDFNYSKNDDSYIIENSSDDIENISTFDESLIEESLKLPPREFILNNINWSNYSLLRNPYIHNYEISDPTDVINHKFLYVTIVVEVIDARDIDEVLKQLSSVVIEEQKILGPNSAPNVWGTADGIWVFYTAIRPFETDVCARYLP